MSDGAENRSEQTRISADLRRIEESSAFAERAAEKNARMLDELSREVARLADRLERVEGQLLRMGGPPSSAADADEEHGDQPSIQREG